MSDPEELAEVVAQIEGHISWSLDRPVRLLKPPPAHGGGYLIYSEKEMLSFHPEQGFVIRILHQPTGSYYEQWEDGELVWHSRFGVVDSADEI